jgi:hypothetical protein
VQGKKGLDNKSGGSRKRKPYLPMRAKEIIFNYDPCDIERLTVNEISRNLCIRVPHLSKTFRKETGVTLKDIII